MNVEEDKKQQQQQKTIEIEFLIFLFVELNPYTMSVFT